MGETRRRNAILEVATRLFAEKGYGNTTTAEIAHEAGVAEGTLYHHFGSKDGIFLTIFDETVSGYLDGGEKIVRERRDGAEALSALIRFHFEYLGSNATPFVVILRDFPSRIASDGKGPGAGSRRRFARMTDLLSDVLSRGASDGTLRLSGSVRDTAEMIRGILYGTSRHMLLGIIEVPLPRLARMVETFCLQALASASPPDKFRKDTVQT